MRAYICRELPRDFVGETVVVTCHRDTSLAGATLVRCQSFDFSSLLDVV